MCSPGDAALVLSTVAKALSSVSSEDRPPRKDIGEEARTMRQMGMNWGPYADAGSLPPNNSLLEP